MPNEISKSVGRSSLPVFIDNGSGTTSRKDSLRVRVGVVGAGWVSRYHLKAWQRLAPHATVVAIADPHPETLRSRAAEFGLVATYSGAETLVRDVSPDVLDICAPRESHAGLVRLAATYGIPAICQKPLAMNLAEAQSLVRDVGGRIPLMVHENWRFRRYCRRIADLLREGTVGKLRHARLDFLSSGMIPDKTGARPALVRQPFLRGLDRLLVSEILIHHLDTLRFLLGEMDVVSAYLARSNDEIIGEDGATLFLRRREDGVPVHVCGDLSVHGMPPLPSDKLRIVGSDGVIVLDGASLRTFGKLATEDTFDPDATYQGAYDSAIEHFVDRLQNGLPFETGPQDNLKTPAIVERTYEIADRAG